MQAQSFVRFAYTERADLPEAEFCTVAPLNWAPLSVMEQSLVGSLLATGINGYLWQAESLAVKPNLGYINEVIFPSTSISEFRLRVGFSFFSTLHIGAIHTAAVQRIARSQEMQPWVLPGTAYNMPIQRRIAEEAGVPRPLFGQRKRASAFAIMSLEQHFSENSRADFLAFCRQNGLPTTQNRSLLSRWFHRASQKIAQVSTRLFHKLPGQSFLRLMPYTWWLYGRSSHLLWRSPLLYTFHWGFDRTQARYTGALEAE